MLKHENTVSAEASNDKELSSLAEFDRYFFGEREKEVDILDEEDDDPEAIGEKLADQTIGLIRGSVTV